MRVRPGVPSAVVGSAAARRALSRPVRSRGERILSRGGTELGSRGGTVGDWNIASVWEAVAAAVPEQTAVIQGDCTRTWREYDERAARFAAAMHDLGVRPDSKIALYLFNSNEYLEVQYGTLKLRAVPVNVNYRYLEDELAYLLENSDAEVVVFHGSLGPQIAAVRDRLPQLKAAIQVDDGSPHVEGALK